jgi:error-prone DNA polymerase
MIRCSRVLALARKLMGFPRHLSQHVGGFVLTRGRLDETVPIGNAAMDDRTFIEWDKDDIDRPRHAQGRRAGARHAHLHPQGFRADRQAPHGQALTLATVPRDDPAVYDMLCKADSIGVFQVEAGRR